MELLLDTANVEEIKHYNDIYEFTGVTTNPTIISREKGDFFSILEEIRNIMGDKQLHVQVTADICDDMLKEAENITSRLGKDTYIKVPTNEEGIKTIKLLKQKGFNVTATAIYTTQQALLAANVGADYAAPYFNRMSNNNYDAATEIANMATLYEMYDKPTKILAASFKNTNQIIQALLAGAKAITSPPELFTTMVESPLIDSAIDKFKNDWTNLYGNKKIYNL